MGDALDARVLEGELLYLGGRHADAARVIEQTRKEAPHDLEIRQWADHISRKREGMPSALPPAGAAPAATTKARPGTGVSQPGTPRAATAPPPVKQAPSGAEVPQSGARGAARGGIQGKARAPAARGAGPAGSAPQDTAGAATASRATEPPAVSRAAGTASLPAAAAESPPVPPEPAGLPPGSTALPEPDAGRDEPHETALERSAVCEDIFHPCHTTLEASCVFEERYEGSRVSWKGTLKSVEEYSFDFVFGDKPGTKACLEIHDVASGIYGTNKIQALVQLEPGRREHLLPLVGKAVGFEGRLLRADGFLHNLYVTEGKLE